VFEEPVAIFYIMNTSNEFTSSATIMEGEHYTIDGLNIWDYQWKKTGEKVLVTDMNGRKASLPINEICANGKLVQFAINEVSNGVFIVHHKYYSH
jgi:hypothetical protein